jgi:hypothetical protein
VDEHFHPINHRSEVEGMDTVNTGIEEDRAEQLSWRWLKESPRAWYWRGTGAARHHQTRQEWEELAKSGCSKDQPTFTTQDSNCSLS